MRRSTTALSLALLGSAVFLTGCSRDSDDDEWDETSARGGGHVVPFIGRGLTGGARGGTSAPSPGVSARGGFGGIGAGLSAGS
jgi:hypothetical protein